MNINAAIIGASGYVGGELLRVLSSHPNFTVSVATSSQYAGQRIDQLIPNLLPLGSPLSFTAPQQCIQELKDAENIALFSAAPHGAAANVISELIQSCEKNGSRVHTVDCSADFRFSDPALFESVYGIEHPQKELLKQFKCALPEHTSDKGQVHIAHPGCFATAMLLSAMPLVRNHLTESDLYISGITGSSGSGRQPSAGTHHPERHANLYAYKPLQHRHAAEVNALLNAEPDANVKVNFVPHSGPFARGIHATLQAKLKTSQSAEQLRDLFQDFYADAPFVHIVDGTPRLKNVVSSNYAQLGISTDGDTICVNCVIDNLLKGAAGSAIQWMNRLWQLPEEQGLQQLTPAWI